MKYIFLLGLFFGLTFSTFSQISSIYNSGNSTMVSCDSVVNFSIFNAQLPPVVTGDFNLIATNINSGTYSIVANIDWGDGSTTTYQGTANSASVGNLVSFNPPVQHMYSNAGTYTIVMNYTSTNGGPAGTLTFVYSRITCSSLTVPTTGSNSVACGANLMLYDAGGPNGNYNSNSSGYTVLSNSGSGQITLSGSYTYLETNYDTLKIFAGSGIGGQLLYTYNGTSGGTIVPFTSQPGQPLTVQLVSDQTVVGAGFAMLVQYSGSCAPITTQLFAIAQVDCNNDGSIDSTISNGVPIIISNSSNSYSGTTQNGAFSLQNIAPGTYSATIDPNWLNTNGYVINSIFPTSITVSTSGAMTFAITLSCAGSSSLQCVSGTVYNDINGNGSWDNGENPIANAAINVIYNGQNYVAYSNTSGNYSLTYNGTTGDSISVEANAYWLYSLGCTPTNISTIYYSASCVPGIPPSPVNIGINCGSNVPSNCYSGYVYCDANNNGVMNAGEQAIPFAPVYLGVSPNSGSSVVVYTDSSGFFSYCGQIGSSNIAIAWLNSQWLGYQGYTATNSIITLVGSSTSASQPGYLSVNCGGVSCSDLWTTVTPWIGYYQNTTAQIKLNWGNYGPTMAGAYQLTLTFPVGVTVNTSSIQNTGYTISGNTITWNLTNSNNTFSSFDFISFSIPGGLINGAQHYFTSTITSTNNTDCNSQNNAGSLLQILGNSYDPNDKTVERPASYQSSTGPIEIIEPNLQDKLTYTIRFQNTGTAPAQNIYILDTLSANLDWSTFSLISTSHPVQLNYQGNGQVRFEFNQIWLPDSTSNEPESHGQLVYSISENSNCLNGCSIENTAYIYFDWNPPIITNTTYNINESIGGIMEYGVSNYNLFPNPTSDLVNIQTIGKFQYELMDIYGKLIERGSGTDQKQVDLSSFESGLYVLQLVDANGRKETKRAIKK